MASQTKLQAATQERKARLAQLKTLKRKQLEPSTDDDASFSTSHMEREPTEQLDVTQTYLSGRNYDAETRGPKLGFEFAPTEGQETLETRATVLADDTRKLAEDEATKDAPLDLFKLQPKKPNWDLKRELREKMQILDVRTDNAIARLVRERLEGQKKIAGNGEATALDGNELLGAVHAREREEMEDGIREMQWEKDAMDDE